MDLKKYTLKALRVNAGLKLGDSADRLGISTDALTDYESGKTFPRIDTVVRMMELYHCTFNEMEFFLK